MTKLQQFTAMLMLSLLSGAASATSYFDATTAATYQTNVVDTAADAAGFAIGLMAVLTITWYGVRALRKAASIAGARG